MAIEQLISAALHGAKLPQLDNACQIAETDPQILRLKRLPLSQDHQKPTHRFRIRQQMPKVELQAAQTLLQAPQCGSY